MIFLFSEVTGLEVDPFDTSFADNILPGRVELKIIEKEILREDIQFTVPDDSSELFNGLKIQISDTCNQINAIGEEKRVSGTIFIVYLCVEFENMYIFSRS